MLAKENFMQVTNNNTSSLQFSGAFRFKPNEFNAKADVPKLFTQGRQVFHNILEDGDEVIVVRKIFFIFSLLFKIFFDFSY